MVYSKSLAARIRQMLHGRPGIVEKKMFGGVCFLLRGNMLVGVWQDALIVRLGVDEAARALAEPYVREFDITGRADERLGNGRGRRIWKPTPQLAAWIDRAAAFVETLPPK